MPDSFLRAEYNEARRQCGVDIKSTQAGMAIERLALTSMRFITEECEQTDLISLVRGKQYFSYKKANVVARPANRELFLTDPEEVARLWEEWMDETISPVDFAKMTYTVALAPCLAMEILDRQNKKGPATFFECYIGHLFAKAIGINPTTRARLPIGDQNVLMTMDFLFDLGSGRRKVHLPVKMSTRERVVQAWAHQRILDASLGAGAYRGILVLFSETKLDSRSLEVVEICVPDQWIAYQSLLARMDRIYYFDVPGRYQTLTERFPELIIIKQFGEFFRERETVLRS